MRQCPNGSVQAGAFFAVLPPTISQRIELLDIPARLYKPSNDLDQVRPFFRDLIWIIIRYKTGRPAIGALIFAHFAPKLEIAFATQWAIKKVNNVAMMCVCGRRGNFSPAKKGEYSIRIAWIMSY